MSEAEQSRFSVDEFIESGSSPEPSVEQWPERPRRRWGRLAVWLAVATFISTFWAGVTTWAPVEAVGSSAAVGSFLPVRMVVLANWWHGLQFSLALMCILAAHEFGHYLLTVFYRVPSTPPLFIPFPISPLGTLGAVIAMQGGEADRRQIFDIGLAGPLAGLVVTIPVLIYGMLHPHPFPYAPFEVMQVGQPLLVQWLASFFGPERVQQLATISNSEIDPLVMAGWVGLLVTGLNMMPIGQLDGGHVAFGLIGYRSQYLGILVAIAAAIYMLYAQVWIFLLMLILVAFMGFRHPPSRDDNRSLGWFRSLLGWICLSIPILCIPANPLIPLQ